MKYQVTDRVLYRTIHWTVETDDDTFYIRCQEGDFDETWYVESDNEGDIDINSELGRELIDVCTDYEVIDDIDSE